MKNKVLFAMITGFFTLNSFLNAQIIRVPADHATIQEAIDAASAGDTVLVSPGIYYENIMYRGKNIVVASNYILEKNTEYILNTIIDGSRPAHPDTGSCVMFLHGENSSAVIQGFTIRNGTGWFVVVNGFDSKEGGGIMLIGSSATIRNNLIINNCAYGGNGIYIGGGGGISALWNGNPTIENNVIMLNRANYGAGMAFSYSGATVRNNIIFRNYDNNRYGGAGLLIIFSNPHKGIFENNTIIGNISTTRTGAISSSTITSTSVVRNNIIWGNQQVTGKQVEEHAMWNPVPEFKYVTYEYNDSEDESAGTGNFSVYPDFSEELFVLNTNSVCVDAGDTAIIYNDNETAKGSVDAQSPSLGGLRNDIGAYGGQGAAAFPDFSYEELDFSSVSLFFNLKVHDTASSELYVRNMSTHSIKIDSIIFPGEITGIQDNKKYQDYVLKPLRSDTIPFVFIPEYGIELEDSIRIYHNGIKIENPVKIKIKASIQELAVKTESNFLVGDDMKIFPNPAIDVLNISVTKEIHGTQVQLYDITGKLVFSGILNGKELSADISGLDAGIYFLKLDMICRKIIIR